MAIFIYALQYIYMYTENLCEYQFWTTFCRENQGCNSFCHNSPQKSLLATEADSMSTKAVQYLCATEAESLLATVTEILLTRQAEI